MNASKNTIHALTSHLTDVAVKIDEITALREEPAAHDWATYQIWTREVRAPWEKRWGKKLARLLRKKAEIEGIIS